MTDLFQAAHDLTRIRPLPDVVRPATIDEVIGQQHLLAPGKILRRKMAAGRLGSILLYGPPGTGKTTIARAVGASMKKEFRQLHTTENNTADLKAVADEARHMPILLFIDEIHRFNVAQQDRLLSTVEEGRFDLITATTSNPYHVLTPALVSRSTTLQLQPLSIDEVAETVKRGIRYLQGKDVHVQIAPEVLRSLAGRAGGDARRALIALEDIVAGANKGDSVPVSQDDVDEVYQSSASHYDRSGDQHYDFVSSFLKSMRGSDPDATLYWLGRLIHAGEDPRFIARRLLIHASEDVGLADNSALATAAAALQAVQTIGYPESRIVLAQAALHICLAPKSNSACRGIDLALARIKQEGGAVHVPPYLKDAHYAGAAKLGHTGYRFPHDDPSGWVEQVYAPGVEAGSLYQSDGRGGATFEQRAEDYWNAVKGTVQARTFPKG